MHNSLNPDILVIFKVFLDTIQNIGHDLNKPIVIWNEPSWKRTLYKFKNKLIIKAKHWTCKDTF